MADIAFWQEVAKETVKAAFQAGILVLGGWIALRRTLIENSRKQREERRERYVTETLVAAFRNLEAPQMRENPIIVGHEKLDEYRILAGEAIRDVQLLGDPESARLAHEIAVDQEARADPEVWRSLFMSLRRALRARLDLEPVEAEPGYLRFVSEARVLAMPDRELEAIDPQLLRFKEMLRTRRGLA